MEQVFARNHYRLSRLTSAREVEMLSELLVIVSQEKQWQLPHNWQHFENASEHWVVHHDQRLLGGCALTVDGPVGLPFESVWSEYAHLKTESSAEIFYLIMEQGTVHEQHTVLLPCFEMFRYCERAGISNVFTCITEKSRQRYAKLGCPFRVVAPERVHWGYPSHLLSVSPREVCEAVQHKSARYQGLFRAQFDREDHA